MTATGKTYGDALYDLAAEEALCDELLEQVKLLARLFRLRRAVRRTIVIEVGMQNAAQAIAVATSPLIFDSGEMAVPAIVYALVMNVVLLSYLKLLPKCTDETASDGA